MTEMSKDILNCLDDTSENEDVISNHKFAEIKAVQLIDALAENEIKADLQEKYVSSNSTSFVIRLHETTTIQRLRGLIPNLQMQLSVNNLEIVPIPEEMNTIAVIVSNPTRTVLTLRDAVLSDSEEDSDHPLMFFLGEDASGLFVTALISDLSPIFIGGSTGSGKSLFIHSLICKLLLLSSPEEVKLLLIDNKKIEFSSYQGVPHLIAPVLDTTEKAMTGLKFVAKIVDERINHLSKNRFKSIDEYNEAISSKTIKNESLKRLPYVVVIIDDITDLLVKYSESFEELYLNAISRAGIAGVYFVLSAQLPSAAVIPKSIVKSADTRIAFAMASQRDSITVLDTAGAEMLQNSGELLYRNLSTNEFFRLQGIFVSDGEIDRVAKNAKRLGSPQYDDFFVELKMAKESSFQDPLYTEAKEYVIKAGKASTSLLQRRFGIGYRRASKLIDALEEESIIGSAKGTEPRKAYRNGQDGEIADFNPVQNIAEEKDVPDIDYSMTMKLVGTEETNTSEINQLSSAVRKRSLFDRVCFGEVENRETVLYDWLLIFAFMLSSTLSIFKISNSFWDIAVFLFGFLGILLVAPFLRKRVNDTVQSESLRRKLIKICILVIGVGWIFKFI